MIAAILITIVIFAISVYESISIEDKGAALFIAYISFIVCGPLLFYVGLSSNFLSGKEHNIESLERQVELKQKKIEDLLRSKSLISTIGFTPKKKLTLWELDFRITDFYERSGTWFKYDGVLDYEFKANCGIDLEKVYVRETESQWIFYGLKGELQGTVTDHEEWKLCEIKFFNRIVIPGRFFDYKDEQRNQLKERIRTGQGQKEVEPILKLAEMSATQMIEIHLGDIAKNLGKEIVIKQDEPHPGSTINLLDFIQKISTKSQNPNRIQSTEK